MDRLAEDHPRSAELAFLRGELFRLRRRPEDAERAAEAYRSALRLDLDHARAHRALGLLLLSRGDAEAGRAELEANLELVPQAGDRAMIEAYLGRSEP